jgi:uncharacterized protein YdaU (DUF1376 family)
MKPPACQFYFADFLVGTMMMTAEEVGGYIRLLCHQWDAGSIPDDDEKLARMAGCCPAALVAIRRKFPAVSNGCLRNERLEFERAKQAEYREKQAANGRMGASLRWHGDAIATPKRPQWRNDSSSSSSSSSTSNERSNTIDPAFDAFWKSYPKKVGKAYAKRCFTRLVRRNPPAFVAELQSKVVAYAAAVAKWPEADHQFIPHPSTWLNEGRHDDNPAEWQRSNTPDGFRSRPAGESTSEAEKAAHNYEF